MVVTAIVLFLILGFIYLTSTFWVQWWWFGSVGYQNALVTRYVSGAAAFLIAALIAGGFFAVNWQIALRRGERGRRSGRLASSRILRWPLWALTVIFAILAGSTAAQHSRTWARDWSAGWAWALRPRSAIATRCFNRPTGPRHSWRDATSPTRWRRSFQAP
jgi:uncharacterized membrane protein (UPF0182 family)